VPSQILKGQSKNSDYRYNGVDRVNNGIGYEPDNSVSCCKICNRAKDVMTQEGFLTWVGRVQKVQDWATADRLMGACG
jgi:hypothetical protein